MRYKSNCHHVILVEKVDKYTIKNTTGSDKNNNLKTEKVLLQYINDSFLLCTKENIPLGCTLELFMSRRIDFTNTFSYVCVDRVSINIDNHHIIIQMYDNYVPITMALRDVLPNKYTGNATLTSHKTWAYLPKECSTVLVHIKPKEQSVDKYEYNRRRAIKDKIRRIKKNKGI